jgi:hypothetical protein
VDLTQASEDELKQCKIDFPSLEGLYALSASGHLINKSTHPTLATADSVIDEIAGLISAYDKWGIVLSDFTTCSKPVINKTEKRNFFHIGSYNKIIVPYDIVEKGKTSVFVFCTPRCHPCELLKNALLNNKELECETVNFYFVNVAHDENEQEIPWQDVKVTKTWKTYNEEGMEYFPTVWIVSPTGTISSVVNSQIIGSIPYEYIIDCINYYNPYPPPKPDTNKIKPPVVKEERTKPAADTNKFNAPKVVNENIFVEIKQVKIDSGVIKIAYLTEDKVVTCQMKLIIESPKGDTIARETKELTLYKSDGNAEVTLYNASTTIKKKKEYILSLSLTVGKNEVCTIKKQGFETDKSISAKIAM